MLRPIHVLIIDNDPVQRILLRAMLDLLACREGLTFDIEEREDYKDLPSGPFDAVVLDLDLRLSAPHKTVQEIASRAFPGPVICVATECDSELERQAREAGIGGYLVKGLFSAADLAHAILDSAQGWADPNHN